LANGGRIPITTPERVAWEAARKSAHCAEKPPRHNTVVTEEAGPDSLRKIPDVSRAMNVPVMNLMPIVDAEDRVIGYRLCFWVDSCVFPAKYCDPQLR
jgi:hypothetical protein